MKNTQNSEKNRIFEGKSSRTKIAPFFTKNPRKFPKWTLKRAIFKEKGGYPIMLLTDNNASNQEIKASIYYFSRQKSPFFTWKTQKILFRKRKFLRNATKILKNHKISVKKAPFSSKIRLKNRLTIQKIHYFSWKTPFFSKKYNGSYRKFQNTGSKKPFFARKTLVPYDC